MTGRSTAAPPRLPAGDGALARREIACGYCG